MPKLFFRAVGSYHERRCLFQIAAKIVLLVVTNLAGALTHYPSELAKRQAFLETRQCVEARLTTQRQNQQQVSTTTLTVLVNLILHLTKNHFVATTTKIACQTECVHLKTFETNDHRHKAGRFSPHLLRQVSVRRITNTHIQLSLMTLKYFGLHMYT